MATIPNTQKNSKAKTSQPPTQLLTLYHGSRVQVPHPQFGLGNPANDYGLGFYCTQSEELASEWACPEQADGYVNKYQLDTTNLCIANLESPEYNILNWLAVLVDNRRFSISTPLAAQMHELLLSEHLPNLASADVIVGYRADDSYFKFARAFLDNRISLDQLEYAMHLGKLGIQVVMKSQRAFDCLNFQGAKPVPARIWHARRMDRDAQARSDFNTMLAQQLHNPADGLYAIDLLRRS